MSDTFTLHPRLAEDCIDLGRLSLCRLLLMNDSHFPWFILVPEVPNASEIHQLSKLDRLRLIEESSLLAENLADMYRADKMNIAAIGNLVPQLHVHHVVRYKTDAAWPAPVWGKFERAPYAEHEIAAIAERIRERFEGALKTAP